MIAQEKIKATLMVGEVTPLVNWCLTAVKSLSKKGLKKYFQRLENETKISKSAWTRLQNVKKR